MNKYDEFVQKELASKLRPSEAIETTGFLFTKSLALAATLGARTLGGSGYFFAALTRNHLFLIATEMGGSSLKMVNHGIAEYPLTDIQSIKPGGFLNQKSLTITMKDGSAHMFSLNTLATHYASGQKKFIESLVEFQTAAQK